ncbi:delta-like protein 1 [Nematostella vectensis]|uniref:delta-like protein 1 n=1 Tax=Nematostella vectensis TaxID=45351 RepID=UPI00139004AD|nr:delta-like protein 1 [Nematostella vectensis]
MTGLGAVLIAVTAAYYIIQADGVDVAIPSNQRMQMIGLDCVKFMWSACSPPQNCTVNLKLKKLKSSSTNPSVTSPFNNLSPQLTSDNKSYIFCVMNNGNESSFLDGGCCQRSGIGYHEFEFKQYDYMSFHVENCAADSENCVSNAKQPWSTYVIPSKNPCITGSPCKNRATCSSRVANDFNCTCIGNWVGKDCSDQPTSRPKADASPLVGTVALFLTLQVVIQLI